MQDKNPFEYPIVTYLWIIGLAMVGGIVSYVQQLKRENMRKFRLMEFVGELVTSAFAGIITYWLLAAAGTPPLVAAAATGIAGHMGSRIISRLEQWLEARIKG